MSKRSPRHSSKPRKDVEEELHSMTLKVPRTEYRELQEHASHSDSTPTTLVRSLVSVFLGARRAVKNGQPPQQDHLIDLKDGEQEIVIVERDGMSVRTSFHDRRILADYVRVVDDRDHGKEIAYWSWTEWKEDTNDGEDPSATMNAILSAIQMIAIGSYREKRQQFLDEQEAFDRG